MKEKYYDFSGSNLSKNFKTVNKPSRNDLNRLITSESINNLPQEPNRKNLVELEKFKFKNKLLKSKSQNNIVKPTFPASAASGENLELKLDMYDPARQYHTHSSLNTPTFNHTSDQPLIDTALSSLGVGGDLFALQEAKRNPYYHNLEGMSQIEIRSLKELCEKSFEELRVNNFNELKYHNLNLSSNNKIIMVFLLNLVDNSITLESTPYEIKSALMYHDLNFIKNHSTVEISIEWINYVYLNRSRLTWNENKDYENNTDIYMLVYKLLEILYTFWYIKKTHKTINKDLNKSDYDNTNHRWYKALFPNLDFIEYDKLIDRFYSIRASLVDNDFKQLFDLAKENESAYDLLALIIKIVWPTLDEQNPNEITYYASVLNLKKLYEQHKLTIVNFRSIEVLTSLTSSNRMEDYMHKAVLNKLLKLSFCCCYIAEFLNDESSVGSSRNKSIVLSHGETDDHETVDKNDEEIYYNMANFKKEMDKIDTDVLARILYYLKNSSEYLDRVLSLFFLRLNQYYRENEKYKYISVIKDYEKLKFNLGFLKYAYRDCNDKFLDAMKDALKSGNFKEYKLFNLSPAAWNLWTILKLHYFLVICTRYEARKGRKTEGTYNLKIPFYLKENYITRLLDKNESKEIYSRYRYTRWLLDIKEKIEMFENYFNIPNVLKDTDYPYVNNVRNIVKFIYDLKYDGFKVKMANDHKLRNDEIEFKDLTRIVRKFDKEQEVKMLYTKICDFNELNLLIYWNEANCTDINIGKLTYLLYLIYLLAKYLHYNSYFNSSYYNKTN